jgi:uncharacterized hydrophobic protein (TIGR00271 family)
MISDSLKRRLYARLDLRHDQADNAEVDATFRAGVEFRGTNLWVLIFAIFIASIGLNVNSTAVIIGAMLISPLMGPIMALGYGAGINDSALMRSALFNLGLAAFISLLASAAYFWATPLTQAHSELLARTTPSIWDVMIALFGGLAGAIGVTRRVKSNVIPGVAIATALMPPLCTAGYGLAMGNMAFFLGALYLFAINGVFIAIATLMMVRVLRLPSLEPTQDHSALRRRAVIGGVVVLTLVPSVILAISLVQREWFDSNASNFVQQVLRSRPNLLVVSQEPDFKARQLRLSLVGDRLSEHDIKTLEQRLPEFGLAGVALQLAQSGQVLPDMNVVKKDLINEFLLTNRADIAERDARILALQGQLQELKTAATAQIPVKAVYQEIRTQFPDAVQVNVATGFQSVAATPGPPATAAGDRPLLLVQLELRSALSADEQERLRLGLRTRAGLADVQDVRLEVSVPPVPTKAVSRRTKKR